LIAPTLIYGHRRLGQTPEHVTAGPLVGSVQPNIPSEIKESPESGDTILDDLTSAGKACFDAGAEFVAWPETIVLSSLNSGYVDLCQEGTRPKIYDRIISDHTKDTGYVLLGAHSADVDVATMTITDRYNSAFLYTPAGLQDPKRYDKMHLVPFGEYIPFKESAPFIYRWILNLSPYDYDYNLTKGAEFTTFEMKTDNKKYGFGALICYDDTDPKIARRMVVSDAGAEKADWLVNISNDGWYVRYKNEKVLPSVELSQRTAITAFRAVENRVSIIRSVNTGISCLIDSTGLIRDGFISGNLPEAAMDRQGVEGWFVDRIAIDDRVTFFSRHGQWLEFLCGAVITAVVPAACIDAARRRRSGKADR
ncbi:MAG: apolipoprotein N-acyltransferase, partial [Planctomycetota bacterium]